jgi:hypothetical protein
MGAYASCVGGHQVCLFSDHLLMRMYRRGLRVQQHHRRLMDSHSRMVAETTRRWRVYHHIVTEV